MTALQTVIQPVKTHPIVFYHSHAGDGSIRVAVNQAQIVRKLDDLPLPDGFIEDLAYAYGGATKDPTLYEYPDIFCADGSMREGIYMVLLDVTVANPDSATSRYQNENGKWCDHYENPYLFQAQSICHLINRSASTDKQMYLSYFSEKSDKWKNPDSFLLEGGDEKNFQLGFLVGYDTFVENNQFIGKPVSPEDILLWTLLPEFSSATWELNLH